MRKRTRVGRRGRLSEREVRRWVEIQTLRRAVEVDVVRRGVVSLVSTLYASEENEARGMEGQTNLSSSTLLPSFLRQPLNLPFQEDDLILKGRVSTLEVLDFSEESLSFAVDVLHPSNESREGRKGGGELDLSFLPTWILPPVAEILTSSPSRDHQRALELMIEASKARCEWDACCRVKGRKGRRSWSKKESVSTPSGLGPSFLPSRPHSFQHITTRSSKF